MVILTNDLGETVKISYANSIDAYFDEDLGCTAYEVGIPTIRCNDPRNAEYLRVNIQKAITNIVRDVLG